MNVKRIGALLVSLCLAAGLAPGALAADTDQIKTIVLNSTEQADGTWTHSAAVDGAAAAEYDYTWHCDPSEAHSEVKNAPAEYYTGTRPGADGVYIAHDVFYFPELPASGFRLVSYDGEQEWAYYYTDGVNDSYLFATLPAQGGGIPTQMMHSAGEAYQNAVLHITEAGTYSLQGTWHGQIWIDLGDGAQSDPDAKVTLLLNGVDVTCTVAPALVFYSVYECDQAWLAYDDGQNDAYTPSCTVDTSEAGAVVVLADGTENSFSGANIYRMLKTAYKSGQEDAAVPVQKKLRKLDAAFYSYMSMNIEGQTAGSGVLNVTSGFEGLDTEQHLSFNGGHVNIFSQDDGVNVNEDGVSVVAFNGGEVHILAGLGSEGDGVDSNGYLVVNGGTVISMANPASDSGLDSDCGSYVNGGAVVALGSAMDWAEADDSNDSKQVTMNLRFSGAQSSDEAIIVTKTDGTVVFAYDPDKDEVAGSRIRSYQGAVISCAAFQVGESYRVYVGGDVTGTEYDGVYDAATVTGFSEDAKQQCWTGTWEDMGRPGGGQFDGQMPDGMQRPEDGAFDGQTPDGMQRPEDGAFDGQTPDGMRRPEDGTFDGQMPDGMQRPEDGAFDGQTPGGMQRPEDGAFDGQMPDGIQRPEDGQFGGQTPGGTAGNASVLFPMEDKVNNFSGVSDYAGGDAAAGTPQTIESAGVNPEASGVASDKPQTILVNGVAVEFLTYALTDESTGNYTNYVKLRDLAYVLNGTDASFSVSTGDVLALASGAYAETGTEMRVPFTGSRSYQDASGTLMINGAPMTLRAFLLTDDNGGGYTYFKLRDLAKALDFYVDYEDGLVIDTSRPYSE